MYLCGNQLMVKVVEVNKQKHQTAHSEYRMQELQIIMNNRDEWRLCKLNLVVVVVSIVVNLVVVVIVVVVTLVVIIVAVIVVHSA